MNENCITFQFFSLFSSIFSASTMPRTTSPTLQIEQPQPVGVSWKSSTWPSPGASLESTSFLWMPEILSGNLTWAESQWLKPQRVRLPHAPQLTKAGCWQILHWSCCWSAVSGKWGLTKLQLCHSSSVGCLQTVRDWSTVGPLAHSLFQIKSELLSAVPSSPPSKLLFCLLWEVLLPCPSLSITVTRVTRAGLLAPAPHNGTDNSSKPRRRDKRTFATPRTALCPAFSSSFVEQKGPQQNLFFCWRWKREGMQCTS